MLLELPTWSHTPAEVGQSKAEWLGRDSRDCRVIVGAEQELNSTQHRPGKFFWFLNETILLTWDANSSATVRQGQSRPAVTGSPSGGRYVMRSRFRCPSVIAMRGAAGKPANGQMGLLEAGLPRQQLVVIYSR